MKYLYDGHLGGLRISDEILGYDQLYCEQCGDSDSFIGSFETIKDFWNLIKDECDIDGSGGLALQYVYPIMVAEFGLSDNLEYDDQYSYLVCCNSDQEILNRIKELI